MDDASNDFENMSFETVTITQHIDGINNTNNNRDQVFTTLNIKLKQRPGNHTLTAKVDTGAQGNIIPLRLFRRMFPTLLDAEGFPKLGATTPVKGILTAYNGTQIPQHGSITVPCKFNSGEWIDAEFFIADATGPAFIGLPSSRALKLLTMNCAIRTPATPTPTPKIANLGPIRNKKDLKAQYPDRFTGIGKFPGQFHITPTLEEITHKFSGARVFSKLDARHGYWSIELDSASSYLTTFNSPFGRYRFKRLPFGLKVSQDIFQEKMDMILEQCPGTIGIADDVAVFGHDMEEHNKNHHNLMHIARKYGRIFNLDKCDNY